MVNVPWHFHRPTYAEIDLRRLVSNFEALRSLFPSGTFICPMVKANAYGHGDVEVSRTLRGAGAEHLGVGLIEEGMGLRLAGDTGSILLFGIFEERSADAVLEFELTSVLSAWHQIEALEAAAKRRGLTTPAKVHLKFNTGMNRLGFSVSEAAKLRARLEGTRALRLEGLCTHLLRGDDAGIPGGESESQLALFAEAVSRFDGMSLQIHALNSSGTANLWKRALEKSRLGTGGRWPLGARPGLATYGIQPTNDSRIELELAPVLELKSRLVTTHQLEVGARVSYNATWRAKRPSLIGVVPAGYADGVFRALSNKGRVLVRGEFAPMIGTICMDYFMVDLTDVDLRVRSAGDSAIEAGEEIVMIGAQAGKSGRQEIGAGEWAALLGTIPYEVLTHISERVPRLYLRDTSHEPAQRNSPQRSPRGER